MAMREGPNVSDAGLSVMSWACALSVGPEGESTPLSAALAISASRLAAARVRIVNELCVFDRVGRSTAWGGYVKVSGFFNSRDMRCEKEV